jgi:hypothetical protein
MARRKKSNLQTVTPPSKEDGSIVVENQYTGFSGYFQSVVLNPDFNFDNENALIAEYRNIAEYPDVSDAIAQICNEAIVAEEDSDIVTIGFSDAKAIPKKIQERILEEFQEVLQLLNFDTNGYQVFQRWYIDGRLYYQKIVDDNKKKGLLGINYINPTLISKISEVKKVKGKGDVELYEKGDEYYIVRPKGKNNVRNTTGTVKLPLDAVVYVNSGIIDLENNFVQSHLHKAIRPTNLLKMQEAALVIYRLSRAPERRVFYIDVGNLPTARAEQHVNRIMSRYQNKVTFDADTGATRGDKRFLSMLEDFWLPRGEGGKTTEVTTLPGGQNLGEIEDVRYFQQKLYKALNVPLTRLQPDQASVFFGKQGTITRDELSFAKFVTRLQSKFSELFEDLLRTQLILKGVVTEDEWEDYVQEIKYEFNTDSYYEESKRQDILQSRLSLLRDIKEYVGEYFTEDYVLRKVLNFTEEEIKELEAYKKKAPPPKEEGEGEEEKPEENNTPPQFINN